MTITPGNMEVSLSELESRSHSEKGGSEHSCEWGKKRHEDIDGTQELLVSSHRVAITKGHSTADAQKYS